MYLVGLAAGESTMHMFLGGITYYLADRSLHIVSRFDRAHQVSDPRISIQSRRFRHVGHLRALHLSGPSIGPRPEHFSVPVPWPRIGSGRSTRMPTTSELRTRDWAACLHAYSPHTLGISVSCSLVRLVGRHVSCRRSLLQLRCLA